jgi:toxin-antitoxin system PIN domain toxin
LSASARLLDTGIWISLAFESHPQHRTAREVFEGADSNRPVAFCRATQNSVLRLLTTPTIQQLYGAPIVTNAQAWAKTQELLALPQVIWLAEPVTLEAEWKRCGAVATASPKVWMDAYLAAFAIAAGLELLTFDRDFTKFTEHGLRLHLLGAKAIKTRKRKR